MDLNDVLSDKPLPARTEITESATDEKPSEVETPTEATATSAVQGADTAKPTEKPETEKPAPARDDSGKFVKTVPHEALHAAKLRNKELEEELGRLKAQQPKADFFADPDKAMDERIAVSTREIRGKFFNLSLKAASMVPGREDFQDVYKYVSQELIDSDPSILAQIQASDDPGETIYTIGKFQRELKEAGGDITRIGEARVSKVKEQLTAAEARIKALEADIETLKSSKDKQSRIPQSLNSETSATARADTFAGPRPIQSILSS